MVGVVCPLLIPENEYYIKVDVDSRYDMFEGLRLSEKTVKIYLKLDNLMLLSVMQPNYESSYFKTKKYAELRIVISIGV